MTEINLLTKYDSSNHSTTLAEIAALDDRIARLEQLIQASQLGLGDPPVHRTIYCNTGNGSLWYFWDGGENKAIPIEAKSITGFVKELKFEASEYKDKEKKNMKLTLDCGRQKFTLSAGHQSVFATCIYLTLGAMTAEQMRQPITIGIKAGTTEEKVLLPTIWINGEFFECPPFSKERKQVKQAYFRAIATIKEVNSHA